MFIKGCRKTKRKRDEKNGIEHISKKQKKKLKKKLKKELEEKETQLDSL